MNTGGPRRERLRRSFFRLVRVRWPGRSHRLATVQSTESRCFPSRSASDALFGLHQFTSRNPGDLGSQGLQETRDRLHSVSPPVAEAARCEKPAKTISFIVLSSYRPFNLSTFRPSIIRPENLSTNRPGRTLTTFQRLNDQPAKAACALTVVFTKRQPKNVFFEATRTAEKERWTDGSESLNNTFAGASGWQPRSAPTVASVQKR